MATVVNARLRGGGAALSEAQRRAGALRLEELRRRNPLRTVLRSCSHLWARDALAHVGDRVWCEQCADHTTVVAVRE